MPKLLRNIGYYLTQSEYDRIKKYEDGYIIELLKCNLDEEMKNKIDEDIKANLSRPQICNKHMIEPQMFDLYLDEQYNTKKITRVRELLLKKN